MNKTKLIEQVKVKLSSSGYSIDDSETIIRWVSNFDIDVIVGIHDCLNVLRLHEVDAIFTDNYICIELDKKYYFNISKETNSITSIHIAYYNNIAVIYGTNLFIVICNEEVYNILGVWSSAGENEARRNFLLCDNVESEIWMGGICYRFR